MEEEQTFYESKWTVEKIEKIQKIMLMCNPASLDQPIGNKDLDAGAFDITCLSEMIEDTAPSPEDIAIQNESKKLLLEIIDKCLGPREAKIILLRFGFEGQPKTLEEIGKIFNVTRERIRQVEAKGLMKIRRYMKSHELFIRSEWNVD